MTCERDDQCLISNLFNLSISIPMQHQTRLVAMNVYSIRLARWLLLAGLSLLLLACEGAAVATPPPVTITVAGSSMMAPVLRGARGESWAAPDVVLDLRGGGGALGEETIRTGRIDIAASTLFPPDSAAGRPALPGGTASSSARQWASTGWRSVVVHPSDGLERSARWCRRATFTTGVF